MTFVSCAFPFALSRRVNLHLYHRWVGIIIAVLLLHPSFSLSVESRRLSLCCPSLAACVIGDILPRARGWPLADLALDRPTPRGCIGRRELRFMLTRIGRNHLSAESAARVGREDRTQFADFVGRGSLSNLRRFETHLRAFGRSNRTQLGVS